MVDEDDEKTEPGVPVPVVVGTSSRPRRILFWAGVLGGLIGMCIVAGIAVATLGWKEEVLADVGPGVSQLANSPEHTTVALPPITVGLRDMDGGHVVRIELFCQMHPDDVYAFQQTAPALKEMIKGIVKDYQAADLEGLEGKNRLRDELLMRINVRLGTPMVERLYYGDFLVQ